MDYDDRTLEERVTSLEKGLENLEYENRDSIYRHSISMTDREARIFAMRDVILCVIDDIREECRSALGEAVSEFAKKLLDIINDAGLKDI